MTADIATVLVYYGALLIIACVCGWAGEKWMMRRDRKQGR